MKYLPIALLLLLTTSSIYAQVPLSAQDKARMQQAVDGILPVLQTTKYQDSLVLRTPSLPLDVTDTLVKQLASLLEATVKDKKNDGVGIAAPQIGINKQLFLIQRFDKQGYPFEAFLNPSIRWKSQLMQSGTEGCLSIPDSMAKVDRHYAIMVAYQTLNGDWKEEIIEGFTAVIFQHEYDHLIGVLFLDRVQEQAAKSYITPKTPLKISPNFYTR